MISISIPNTNPPTIDSLQIISKNKLNVFFNKAITKLSAENTKNYSVTKNVGNPVTAEQNVKNLSCVHLSFATDFIRDENYQLTASNIQDISGNTVGNISKGFVYFLLLAHDIIINEIMADISPTPNSLPDIEYIELYNSTNHPVKLFKWKLSDATSMAIIPTITIQPDSFYILTSLTGAKAFNSNIQVAGVSSFPSLNDVGDDLVLRDSSDHIISSVLYRQNWYNNPLKENGGWSLEQINPYTGCTGQTNWSASEDKSGGTPGRRNSVFSLNPDKVVPSVLSATVLSSNTIRVFFDKSLDSISLINLTNYSTDKKLGAPVFVDAIEPDYKSIVLKFGQDFLQGLIYTLTLKNLQDCSGNVIAPQSAISFAIAETASENDIVINEVMFDPFNDNVEWIEIYNRSGKVFDVKNLYVCSQDKNNNLTGFYQIAPTGFLLFPDQYMVLSTGSAKIKSAYTTSNPAGFIDMERIPTLPNTDGTIVLVNTSQKIIDRLHYDSGWHLPLLTNTKGISLERINYNRATQDENNWHSASENSGGATPATKNSQFTDGDTSSEINVSPQVFSPDEDGYNDILSISYNFNLPEMIGTVNVFDSNGQLVKALIQNELLGTTGIFFWDGYTNEKLKARIGIYIITFETFDKKGNIKKFKKSCVLASKL